MAKDNVYSVLQKPTAKHGRNAFNLNNQHAYSMKAGQIIPIKAIHFMPNDFFKLKANDFSITFPMNSAPFLRMRKEFSFYSVYYSAVWSLYNQYMAGRQDPKSSAFGNNPILQEPRIKLANLYAGCLGQFMAYIFLEYVVPACIWFDAHEALDYSDAVQAQLEKSARETFIDDEFSGIYDFSTSYKVGANTYIAALNLYLEAAPFGMSAFDYTSWDVRNLDSVHNSRVYFDIVGHYRAYNWLRKLDMLGYGNYYDDFRYLEDLVRNIDYKDTTNPYWTKAHYIETIQNYFKSLIYRILSSFATWNKSKSVENLVEDDITSWKMVNLYPICSYNAVFYHFFRNSFYDNDYLSHDYSLDFVSVAGGGEYNEVSLNDFSCRFLDIEYHQWKKDMFTSVLPDEQFGAVSSINLTINGSVPITGSATLSGITGNDENRWRELDSSDLSRQSPVTTASSRNTLTDSVSRILHDHVISGAASISSTGQISASSMFDMIALKRAEMLQEYRQTLMRAGNKTSDVFRALYGGAPSSEHEDDIIPRFLETFGEDLVVDPVVSTADTGQPTNGALGDIAARAKGSGSSNTFKFNAGENFGCILCFAYIVPSAMYNSYMLDKHVLELTPEQHFIPNFENVGLEDVYTDELNMLLPANDMASLGKQARYYHKKTDVDKVHGAFCSLVRDGWLVSLDLTHKPDMLSRDMKFFGEFNHWISVRTDMQTRNITTLRDFYINPSVLDNVFVRAAGADQADDQFLCTTLLEVDATKSISKTGFVNFV